MALTDIVENAQRIEQPKTAEPRMISLIEKAWELGMTMLGAYIGAKCEYPVTGAAIGFIGAQIARTIVYSAIDPYNENDSLGDPDTYQ